MACWSAVISVWTAVPGKTHESGFANFRGTLPSARRLALRLRQQWSFVVFCTQQRCLPFTLAGFPVSAARGELLGFPVGRSSSICSGQPLIQEQTCWRLCPTPLQACLLNLRWTREAPHPPHRCDLHVSVRSVVFVCHQHGHLWILRTGTKDSRKGTGGVDWGPGPDPGPGRQCSVLSGPSASLVRDGHRMFVSRPVCLPRPGPIFSSEKRWGASCMTARLAASSISWAGLDSPGRDSPRPRARRFFVQPSAASGRRGCPGGSAVSTPVLRSVHYVIREGGADGKLSACPPRKQANRRRRILFYGPESGKRRGGGG